MIAPASTSFCESLSDFLRTVAIGKGHRWETLNWMAGLLAAVSHVSFWEVRTLLESCVPRGEEALLSEGDRWIFVFDQAAIHLGIDPNVIPLRPDVTH